VLQSLAAILAPFPNPVRVEGYTDDVPIDTAIYPSNWELSAARAASVARLFSGHGVDPRRLGIIGWSEYRPAAGNDTVQGRNRNRRVLVVVLSNQHVPSRFSTDAQDVGRLVESDPPPVPEPAPATSPVVGVITVTPASPAAGVATPGDSHG
jgi:chemotaxis protein MotB